MTLDTCKKLIRKAQALYDALYGFEGHAAWEDHIFNLGQLLDDLKEERAQIAARGKRKEAR